MGPPPVSAWGPHSCLESPRGLPAREAPTQGCPEESSCHTHDMASTGSWEAPVSTFPLLSTANPGSSSPAHHPREDCTPGQFSLTHWARGHSVHRRHQPCLQSHRTQYVSRLDVKPLIKPILNNSGKPVILLSSIDSPG